MAHSERLQAWITRARKQGMNDDDIKIRLWEAGYTDEQIIEATRALPPRNVTSQSASQQAEGTQAKTPLQEDKKVRQAKKEPLLKKIQDASGGHKNLFFRIVAYIFFGVAVLAGSLLVILIAAPELLSAWLGA